MGTLASVMMQMFLSVAHEKSNYGNCSPGPGTAAPISGLGPSQLSGHRCAYTYDFDSLAQRSTHAVVNPVDCNVCNAFTEHALHRKPVQHGTHKVTARTQSHEADIQSDDASLARKLSLRCMYMEHVATGAIGMIYIHICNCILVFPEVQHCYGQCHIMQRTLYCAGHIRRGDLGRQL